jgi:hypothetical protein
MLVVYLIKRELPSDDISTRSMLDRTWQFTVAENGVWREREKE